MAEENLTLALRCGRVGGGVCFPEFEVGLYVDESALLERLEVVVGAVGKGENFVERAGGLLTGCESRLVVF